MTVPTSAHMGGPKAWATIDGMAACVRIDVDGTTALRLSQEQALRLWEELDSALNAFPAIQAQVDQALRES